MQDIPTRLWYRHPCVIRNSNWRIFVGLACQYDFPWRVFRQRRNELPHCLG